MSKGKRTLRGGSWASITEWCRSADRSADKLGIRKRRIGFRLAKGIPSRVLRGGCWISLRKRYYHSASRNWYEPCGHDSTLGFRLARRTK